MSYLTLLILQSEQKLLAYFREKNATSPDRAVIVDKENLAISPWVIKKDSLTKRPYFRATADNKIWLDEEALEIQNKKYRRIGIWILAIAAVWILVTSSIYFYYSS